ncbi:hypothetical protein [Nocardioides currus]|uniref:Uncharacterized protein n=1 Tax=Nocardioides currus TaxID=2133958 RepID=A0A2R7YZW5_9ACTN|nr:hypothetical protein [Nocardioides currus]PUA81854.1 hypothetical protein C7S10_07305 [Nocardioides currus]
MMPSGHRAQRLAAYDLLGQRIAVEDRGEAAGALRSLVELITTHDGSCEALRSPAQLSVRPS